MPKPEIPMERLSADKGCSRQAAIAVYIRGGRNHHAGDFG